MDRFQLQRYRSMHLWMLIPFALMEAGIALSYWTGFSDKAWAIHIHFWTASVWYLYLVLQPYWATHGNLARHRTQGMLALVIAGGVVFTAISMLHRNIETADWLIANPGKAPIKPWFAYARIITEFFQMLAFLIAICMGIAQRKSLDSHSWWMCASAFMVMEPAVGRGIFFTYVAFHEDQMPNINVYPAVFIEQGLICGLLLLIAWRFGKLRHPATWLALAVNLATFLGEPVGRSAWAEALLRAVIKG